MMAARLFLTGFVAGCLLLFQGCATSARITSPPTDVRAFKAQPPPAADVVAGWAGQFKFESFTSSRGVALPYRLLKPAESRPLPLVIVLHGSGAMGSNNRDQLGPFAAGWAQPGVGPAIVAVPQVATRSATYVKAADGLPASLPGPSFEALLELVDTLGKDPAVDQKRVHLVGFSMGASAALQMVLLRPGRFASVTGFSPVPPQRALAKRFRRERLVLVHGDADTDNPFTADRAWVQALVAAGGRPRFIVYRGMDHRVPPDMLAAPSWRAGIVVQRAR